MEDNKLNTQSVEFEYGNKTVKIETGKIARQATSSIIVTIDNIRSVGLKEEPTELSLTFTGF